jgi:hypothetical protein
MHALTHVLLQVVHSASDTIFTTQVLSEPGLFQKISIIAQAMITFAAVLIAVALFMGAWYVRGVYLKFSRFMDRLDGIASRAKDRIDQIDTFLGVVQEEVESAFVETAATVRGVRTGLRQAFDHNEGEENGNNNRSRPTQASPEPGARVNAQWDEDEDT